MKARGVFGGSMLGITFLHASTKVSSAVEAASKSVEKKQQQNQQSPEYPAKSYNMAERPNTHTRRERESVRKVLCVHENDIFLINRTRERERVVIRSGSQRSTTVEQRWLSVISHEREYDRYGEKTRREPLLLHS
ncbi:hypothetical protein LOK49_LG12G02582 [Camellia lanceoleosa]|uniref:Uncharacterized protein n=1 Tax=Camellia lanceoleosa TaxID=1840588 RepID=A0ACC0FTC9_9ERIC|nr:hypothetical protein LOK49_LG12G02582 [Camellia lanceoleosa]